MGALDPVAAELSKLLARWQQVNESPDTSEAKQSSRKIKVKRGTAASTTLANDGNTKLALEGMHLLWKGEPGAVVAGLAHDFYRAEVPSTCISLATFYKNLSRPVVYLTTLPQFKVPHPLPQPSKYGK